MKTVFLLLASEDNDGSMTVPASELQQADIISRLELAQVGLSRLDFHNFSAVVLSKYWAGEMNSVEEVTSPREQIHRSWRDSMLTKLQAARYARFAPPVEEPPSASC
jgi:hypothetical protein